MEMERQIIDAVTTELTRQAEIAPERLKVTVEGSEATIDGRVDLDALAMVIAGALAGGP